MSTPLAPTLEEKARRDAVMRAVVGAIRENRIIKLPAFDREAATGRQAFGCFEPGDYGGKVGPYFYRFEGEEDLLHLVVMRSDGARITPDQGQTVASFVLPDIRPSLIWLRPGEFSQNYYLAHDELTASLS